MSSQRNYYPKLPNTREIRLEISPTAYSEWCGEVDTIMPLKEDLLLFFYITSAGQMKIEICTY
jgi:hypothetical protein